ncbi:unnamed protein product (macronuclear) [Paramecium tetraurelia]|uniref:Uncharacterized protein n=1 Tax=Paramecium tetraurelia TaxID=5888 RepID=A0DYL1_PARTE|nr:uncharacterized protein GSPATT00003096001 [Paramecium tetraurelia]CAK88128.1 unnamed protein product [Paramecium tetraurelia]|eukprot:XP_001455525.1 hypothetical protein (macronuclear) [Paramecium tetraurelia strain d4-2]
MEENLQIYLAQLDQVTNLIHLLQKSKKKNGFNLYKPIMCHNSNFRINNRILFQLYIPNSKGFKFLGHQWESCKSGKPHFANDLHVDNSLPSQWYQAEIYYQMDNQEYNNYIIGGTLPGLPITLSGMSGRSKYLYLDLNTLNFDGSDVYEEEITKNEKGNIFYKFNNQWIPIPLQQNSRNYQNKRVKRFNIIFILIMVQNVLQN